MWKTLSEKIEDEVLEKYQVEVSNTRAHKGRGELSEWRMVQRVEKINPEHGVKKRRKRHAGEPNRKGGDEAAAKDENHNRYDKENQIKRQNGREQRLVGQ